MIPAIKELTCAKVAKPSCQQCVVRVNVGVLEFVVEVESRKQILWSVNWELARGSKLLDLALCLHCLPQFVQQSKHSVDKN